MNAKSGVPVRDRSLTFHPEIPMRIKIALALASVVLFPPERIARMIRVLSADGRSLVSFDITESLCIIPSMANVKKNSRSDLLTIKLPPPLKTRFAIALERSPRLSGHKTTATSLLVPVIEKFVKKHGLENETEFRRSSNV